MPIFEPLSWLAADLLAVVLSAMTLAHLVRQRQEPGAVYLAYLAAAAIAWAGLDFWMVATGDPATREFAARLIYVPQAILVLAWLGFAFGYTGQHAQLRSGPAVLVAAVGAVTILLVVAGDPEFWLVVGGTAGSGSFGLLPEFGPWRRIHDGWSWAMIVFSSGVLALHVAQSPRHVSRLTFVLGAPIIAAMTSVLTVGSWGIPEWVSLQPLGIAMAGAALGWGLLRFGERAVAPVARNVVVEEMEDAVVVLDRRGRIVDVNRSARDRLDLRLLGPVPVALGATWSSVARELGEAGMTVSERVELPVVGGEMHTFEMSVTLLGPQGGRDRQVLVLRDITRQVEMERELSEAKDSLEKLANRRSLLQQLKAEVDRAHRYQRPLSLVLLDLDHFKRVNDTYGHAAGDDVLRATARAMEHVCRDLDLPGRMGGEEFAVLLPETDPDGAQIVADRLRIEIARCLHEPGGDASFRVTASLGVATLVPGSDRDIEDLMQAADEALYQAKELGRNRVAISA